VCFTATTLSYNVIYYAEPVTSFWIDLGYNGVGYSLASAVIWLLGGRKAARG